MCISYPIACPTSSLVVLRHSVRLVLRLDPLGSQGWPSQKHKPLDVTRPYIPKEGGGGGRGGWSTQKEENGFQLTRQEMLY